MNIIFIGCVKFSERSLRHILTLPDVKIVGIITKKKSDFNSDFVSLEEISFTNNIPCFVYNPKSINAMLDWIRTKQADVIYCFGWSHLLPLEIISATKLGVIGYHPSHLPFNKGRHPIIWTIALGLKKSASTFFFMDQGADTGDILDQEIFIVEDDENAFSLYEKICRISTQQITRFTSKLCSNTFIKIPQNKSLGNSWRKRSELDGFIDWRMSAVNIDRLVRALSHPYPGAYCFYKKFKIKILKTLVRETNQNNLEPGKIMNVNGNTFQVKCGQDSIIVLEHDLMEEPNIGEYLNEESTVHSATS